MKSVFPMRRVQEALLVALAALAALLAAYQLPYTYSIDLGGAQDAPFLSGFLAPETLDGIRFRWSTAKSGLVFPAVVQNQDYRVNLRLAAGARPASAPIPQVAVLTRNIILASFRAAPDFTDNSVPVPRSLAAGQSNLALMLTVPTFNPSKTLPNSDDNRNLGVLVDEVRLEPEGRPAGLLALPPWSQLGGWALAAGLWYGFLLRLGLPSAARSRLALALAFPVLLLAALAFLRQWVVLYIWPVTGALAAAALFAPPVRRWLSELRASGRLPLDFLHTLGIPDRRVRAAVELLVVILLCSYFFLSFVWPLHKDDLSDFGVYYVASGLWLQGGNYYDDAQFQQFNVAHQVIPRRITPFIYPPSAAVLFAPLAIWPYAQAKIFWLVGNFALVIGAGALIVLALRADSPHSASPVWLALMLAGSGSLQNALAFGQVSPALFFLMALALWGWTQRRPAATALGIGLGAAVKVFPGLLLLYFLWTRAWRTLLAALAVGGTLLVGTVLLTGPARWLDYIFQILPPYSAHRPSNFDQSLIVFLRRANFLLGILPDNPMQDRYPGLALRIVLILATLGLASLAAWWLVRWRSTSIAERPLGFALAVVLMLLALPIVWEHYLVYLVLPLFIVLNALVAYRLALPAQLALIAAVASGWLFSQHAPDLFTRPDWPPALVSLGLYAMLIVYGCLLYLIPAGRAAPQPAAEAATALGSATEDSALLPSR